MKTKKVFSLFLAILTFLLAIQFVSAQGPTAGTWGATSTNSAPAGRYGHTALAVNGKMLIWGGAFHLNQFRNDGYWYDPASDTWNPITIDNAPIGRLRHTAIWTGDKMIVWGGEHSGGGVTTNTGGIYDPATDTWTAVSLANAPSSRQMHSAVWTGEEMIVWGGCSTVFCSQIFNDGGRYNPATDTWTPMSTLDAPSARKAHSTVWTGQKMIVWGGCGAECYNTGGIDDPATDSWDELDPHPHRQRDLDRCSCRSSQPNQAIYLFAIGLQGKYTNCSGHRQSANSWTNRNAFDEIAKGKLDRRFGFCRRTCGSS